MKRRKFLILAGGSVVLAAGATWIYQSGEVHVNPELARPYLLSTIWEEKIIIETGNAYFRLFPNEKSPRKLVELLTSQDIGDPVSLEKKIIQDYREGQTVIVDGWILSKTEARQCALYFLTHSTN